MSCSENSMGERWLVAGKEISATITSPSFSCCTSRRDTRGFVFAISSISEITILIFSVMVWAISSSEVGTATVDMSSFLRNSNVFFPEHIGRYRFPLRGHKDSPAEAGPSSIPRCLDDAVMHPLLRRQLRRPEAPAYVHVATI